MKIKNVKIGKNKVLKNIDISFEKDNQILDTIVIAGSNGSGKTTLLESICSYFKTTIFPLNEKEMNVQIDLFLENREEKIDENIISELHSINYYKNKDINKYEEIINTLKILPKLIYVPAEIDFNEVKTETTNYKSDYKFFNIVDSDVIEDIPSYISSRIYYIANTEEELTLKEVKEKVNAEINGVFDILDLDVKLTGLSKDEKNMPIFVNSSGDEFDINQLSSGEKQLFLRTLSIKMLEPENSIILIDEPELSLRPKWQQRIIDVYKKIGKNNQIIVATHSPHVLGSVSNENIFLLSKNKKGEIIVLSGDELYTSYGQSADRILEDIMGLETARNPKIFNLLNECRKMVDDNKYNTKEFEEKYSKLKSILGENDEDLFLIEMDIQRKNKEV